MFNEFRTEVSL